MTLITNAIRPDKINTLVPLTIKKKILGVDQKEKK